MTASTGAGSRGRSLRRGRRESRPARRSPARLRAGKRICAGRCRCNGRARRRRRRAGSRSPCRESRRPSRVDPALAPGASGRSWALSAMWRVHTSAKLVSEMRLVTLRHAREGRRRSRAALPLRAEPERGPARGRGRASGRGVSRETGTTAAHPPPRSPSASPAAGEGPSARGGRGVGMRAVTHRRLRARGAAHAPRSAPARRASRPRCGRPDRGSPDARRGISPCSSLERPDRLGIVEVGGDAPAPRCDGGARRRPAGGRDRRRIWRRLRAARASSGGMSASSGQTRASASRVRCGWAASSKAERRTPSWLTATPAAASAVGAAVAAFIIARARSRLAPRARWKAARAGPTQPSATPLPVSRSSALSARSDSRYSAREVNMR